MAFKLEDLLSEKQQLRTVQLNDSVKHAIDLMCEHGYGQLPIVSNDQNFTGQVITFESITRAIQSFRAHIETLLVRDAAHRVRSYPSDAELLDTLDDIHKLNFAVIVQDEKPVGVVTTADAAVFFRKYAQDLMVIEGIESRIKDTIQAFYSNDDAGLVEAISAVTDRSADIRRNFPRALQTYMSLAGVNPPGPLQLPALLEAEKKLRRL